VEIVRIAISDESLRYGGRDEYTAAGYDNVWCSVSYRIELRGVCPAACLAVCRALGRTVGQCAHRENDTTSQPWECSWGSRHQFLWRK